MNPEVDSDTSFGSQIPSVTSPWLVSSHSLGDFVEWQASQTAAKQLDALFNIPKASSRPPRHVSPSPPPLEPLSQEGSIPPSTNGSTRTRRPTRPVRTASGNISAGIPADNADALNFLNLLKDVSQRVDQNALRKKRHLDRAKGKGRLRSASPSIVARSTSGSGSATKERRGVSGGVTLAQSSRSIGRTASLPSAQGRSQTPELSVPRMSLSKSTSDVIDEEPRFGMDISMSVSIPTNNMDNFLMELDNSLSFDVSDPNSPTTPIISSTQIPSPPKSTPRPSSNAIGVKLAHSSPQQSTHSPAPSTQIKKPTSSQSRVASRIPTPLSREYQPTQLRSSQSSHVRKAASVSSFALQPLSQQSQAVVDTDAVSASVPILTQSSRPPPLGMSSRAVLGSSATATGPRAKFKPPLPRPPGPTTTTTSTTTPQQLHLNPHSLRPRDLGIKIHTTSAPKTNRDHRSISPPAPPNMTQMVKMSTSLSVRQTSISGRAELDPSLPTPDSTPPARRSVSPAAAVCLPEVSNNTEEEAPREADSSYGELSIDVEDLEEVMKGFD